MSTKTLVTVESYLSSNIRQEGIDELMSHYPGAILWLRFSEELKRVPEEVESYGNSVLKSELRSLNIGHYVVPHRVYTLKEAV